MTLNGNVLKIRNSDDQSFKAFTTQLQKAYADYNGECMYICGSERSVKSIDFTDKEITIILN